MSADPLSAVAMPASGGDRSTALRWLDWIASSHARAIAILMTLALLCFLPGLFSIPPIDRDEARFAQATKQMLETGDFIDIRLQDEPRYKKPVGIYWLQAAIVSLSGKGPGAEIGFYRLASVLGALAAVLLTYWAAIPMFGRKAAFVAAAAMAVSLILTVEAHLARTDAVLLATVVLAQGALARAYLAPGGPPIRIALLFWVGIGLGVLVKGPVILMISGLTIFALVVGERRAAWLRNLRPLVGIPLAALIVLPWFAGIVSIAGLDFFRQSLGEDLFGKVGSGAEGHWGPPGLHFLLFWFLFFPAVALVVPALPFVRRNLGLPAVRFCLAWIVPNWIVFEIVTTKLPHYTMPLYPAIAALIGAAVVQGLPAGRWWTRGMAIGAALFALCLPIAGLIALDEFGGTFDLAGIPMTIVIGGLAALAIVAGFADRPLDAVGILAIAAVASYIFLFTAIVPRLEAFQVSGRLAEAARSSVSCGDPEFFASGYQEPSLVFLTGTNLRRGNGQEAATFLAEGGCRLALIEDRQRRSFRQALRALGFTPESRARITGMNIGGFRPVDIEVYAALPGARPGRAASEAGDGAEMAPAEPGSAEK
jgi:4-amino-4-deoxy-L-arabinose transferase-like glycosyltransferase